MTKETTFNEFNDSNALNEIHEVEEKMKISTAEIKIYIIEDTLKAEIYNTLSKVEKELVSAIGSVNVFDLNSENFEIIKKIRGLKDTIEEIKGQCK